MSRYLKGKTNLDFTEVRDSEWQWHQLGHMQVCTLLQTDNHASNPPLSFFTGRMPFLPPNQQCQSTEGINKVYTRRVYLNSCISAEFFLLVCRLLDICRIHCTVHTRTTTIHPFNNLFSRTTWVSRYQKGKTSLDLNEATANMPANSGDVREAN